MHWLVYIRDKENKVIPGPDGKEMKYVIVGHFACEADVLAHARKHYSNIIPIGAVKNGQHGVLFTVPPEHFQHGILDLIRAEMRGGGAKHARPAPFKRVLPPRASLIRR